MLSETKSLPEKLSWVKTFWFITEVLSVNKEAMFLLPTFEFNNDSILFLQTVTCLKIIRFHRMSGWWQCSANVAFKNIITNWFISSDSRWWWYRELLTVFLSNWTILSLSNRLQFLLTIISEERVSCRLRKSSKPQFKFYSGVPFV